MGELEFKDFTICYQDENGEMKPFTSWVLNKNGLSWNINIESDKEQMETLENIVNNTDTTVELSSAVCNDDFTYLLETSETHCEFSEELKKELKEISREESKKVIDEKTEFWCQAFINFINGEKNPFDPKLYQNTTNIASEITEDSKIAHTTDNSATIEKLAEKAEENSQEESQKIIDEKWYQWTVDTVETIRKGLQKSQEAAISAAEAVTKFAENSKLIYNKEKEKKGEEMSRTVVAVRFWDLKQNKLGSKEYYYFLNPVSEKLYFRKPERKYWIINDAGFKYENPVIFQRMLYEDDVNYPLIPKITKTIVQVYPFEEVKNIKANKGDNKMNFNKIFPNAEIGKAKNVKMSIYGPAFHTYEEREIAFKDGEWIDVTGLTFDFCPAYVCPVKASEIAVGDFIKHLNCWCRVIGIDGVKITAENIAAHEVITILPVKSMFGFDFYSKLIIPFGDVTADMGEMFSNPFMMMMLFGGDSKNFSDMLPLMFMNGGKFDMSNPMMLYFLMKENKDSWSSDIEF